MIGFFDSGFGGLTIVHEVVQRLPQYSTIYLGDNARAPYGSRTQEEIFQFTREGVEFLFHQGADLVIVACNTSSSSALRRIQHEVLPIKYPAKRVLGVITPTIEHLDSFTEHNAVGILATQATVDSGAYVREAKKYWPHISVTQQACPLLVPMIEQGAEQSEIRRIAKEYLDQLLNAHAQIDAVLLGCTHYALIADVIQQLVPRGMRVVSQGSLVATQLVDYLQRHPEINERLDKQGAHTFFTTGNQSEVERLARVFYGEGMAIQHVALSGQACDGLHSVV